MQIYTAHDMMIESRVITQIDREIHRSTENSLRTKRNPQR